MTPSRQLVRGRKGALFTATKLLPLRYGIVTLLIDLLPTPLDEKQQDRDTLRSFRCTYRDGVLELMYINSYGSRFSKEMHYVEGRCGQNGLRLPRDTTWSSRNDLFSACPFFPASNDRLSYQKSQVKLPSVTNWACAVAASTRRLDHPIFDAFVLYKTRISVFPN